jgi:histidyl-tRNA synthetase
LRFNIFSKHMSKIKPSLPKGTRDFGPTELRKRQYIFNTIKSVFEKYGFQPIETPVMENLSTLEGKYGEEGDKLLFRILNSGDNLSEIQNSKNEIQTNKELIQKVSEKGLRYDLTIPFARYVVMHQNDIAFPFKRYQIQPVWRADRPQKGRYREFYQCDADVVGSDSLLNEVELVLIYAEVFEQLGIDVTIQFNNRKILAGFAEVLSITDKLTAFTVILDKLDKIGKEKVAEEFAAIGISAKANEVLEYASGKNNEEQIEFLKSFLSESDIGLKGIEEIEYLLKLSASSKLNITLARGLDYYTGTIFEVKANNVQMGSIGGGGRYDNLTGVFGLQGVSGVGISFGIERIYDVMEELGLFNQLNVEVATTKVMFVNFGGVNELTAFNYVQQIRTENIAAEIYPANVKMDKQMKYANAKKIPFVAFVGDEEISSHTVKLKNMATGEQQNLGINEAMVLLKKV